MMKKRMLTLVLALMMCLTLIPATAFAQAPPGCPKDGQGMDSIWGYMHMDFAADVRAYAMENGWTGRASMPQGWGDYEKFPGSIIIRNHTNVAKGQWWQLEFSLLDDTFSAVLKLYYSPGSSPGTVVSEEAAGSGNLAMPELEYVIDRCTEKINATGTKDVPSEWAAAETEAAIAAGLVPENLQQNYTRSVSRGNIAQMFINLIEQSAGQTIEDFMAKKNVAVNSNAFTDTSDKAVLAANALGIINGVGDNRFNPDGILTRGQIAAIINRTARALGVNTNGYSHSFTDVAGHWVNGELGWPVHAGIINGVGNNKYDPDSSLTTEQAIVIAYRALKVFSATDLDAPSVSADSFDWVDIATTYDGILRPYAESLGFGCEYGQATDVVNGGTFYFLYFTKGEVRITVAPQPASDCYTYMVGKPDDSVAQSRIEESASIQSCTSSRTIKDVLKSAS